VYNLDKTVLVNEMEIKYKLREMQALMEERINLFKHLLPPG
jgi:hypothetical protein